MTEFTPDAQMKVFIADAQRVAMEVREKALKWAVTAGYELHRLAFVEDGTWVSKLIWTKGSRARQLGRVTSNLTADGRYAVSFVAEKEPLELRNLAGKIYMVRE